MFYPDPGSHAPAWEGLFQHFLVPTLPRGNPYVCRSDLFFLGNLNLPGSHAPAWEPLCLQSGLFFLGNLNLGFVAQFFHVLLQRLLAQHLLQLWFDFFQFGWLGSTLVLNLDNMPAKL